MARTTSGLGLATVDGIVRQSGGHIEIATKPGDGSCVRVNLPLATEPAIPRAQAQVAVLPQAGHETIVLVEDDEAVRALASRAPSGPRVLRT